METPSPRRFGAGRWIGLLVLGLLVVRLVVALVRLTPRGAQGSGGFDRWREVERLRDAAAAPTAPAGATIELARSLTYLRNEAWRDEDRYAQLVQDGLKLVDEA